MNHVVLTAHIAEVAALRYTPAGLPALDLQLEHGSTVSEAGQERKVQARVKAVAIGAVAEQLKGQAIGSQWRFTGFLASARGGKSLVLHIQEFQQD